MPKTRTYKLVVASLFMALGLILPYFTAHAFGVPGTVLLPMHIPVILGGLLTGPLFGAIIGLLTPILSGLLTGMPVVFPMMPIMAAQLMIVGLLTGLLYEQLKLPIYPALLASMVTGWAVYGLMFSTLLFFSGELRALTVNAAITTGIPGLIVQLTLIPALMTALKRYLNRSTPSEQHEESIPSSDFDEALALIKGGDVSCVVMRGQAIIHTADGRGVSPILNLYRSQPETLYGAVVVDKIIGKAAAMILVLGKVERTYGLVMSAAGREYLERHGVVTEYKLCVDVISNRSGNGICPIEKSVLAVDNPEEGLARIEEMMAQLRSMAG